MANETPPTQAQPLAPEGQPAPNRNQKYRPWPKMRKEGTKAWVIDKEKLRKLYLANPHYQFVKFCQAEGFNMHRRNHQEFPVRRWQAEWAEQCIERQDEEGIALAIAARPKLLQERVAFIDRWTRTAKSMQSIHDYLLMLAERDIIHDQQHAAAIAAGTTKARFQMTQSQWASMGLAGEKIAAISAHALLLPKDGSAQTILPIPIRTEEERDAEAELADLQAIEPTVMGPTTNGEELAKSIAGLFDQYREPEALPAPALPSLVVDSIDAEEPEAGSG